MLELAFGQATDPGRIRTNNEDSLGSFIPRSKQQVRSHGYLFALADGVGGSELGEVASASAISTVTQGFAEAQDSSALVSLLPRLVQFANAAVHDLMLTPQGRGKTIATTLVLCGIRHNQAVVSHVGDSRCYLVRDGVAKALTQDHTWVNEQRKLGLITAKEMAESESRHILIRSLGPELFVTVDTASFTVMANDILVLCSDGLHGAVSHEQLAHFVSKNKDMDALARDIVAWAVETDGSDNVSAQLIRIDSVEAVGMYRGRPYILPS